MSRMINNALTTLVESAEAGTFTLPADVLDACRTYTRVRAVELTELEPLHAETAAARLVSAVAAGEDPDLATLAGEVERYRAVREVRRVLATGVKHDDLALFTEIRDGLRSVWPRAGTATAGPPPWPEAPSARLRWLATCGQTVWLPTGAQRDQAWLAAYGDDAQQAQAQRLVG